MKTFDWSDAGVFNPHWNTRAIAAAPMLKGKCILDIGCGAPQFLRTVLPEGTEYLPADLVQWTPETEVCDLGKGQFPANGLSRCNTAVVLGVLEYLEDIPAALRGLSKAPAIVFSYRFGKRTNKSRFTPWQAWTTMRSLGYVPTSIKVRRGYVILRFVRDRRQAAAEIFRLG